MVDWQNELLADQYVIQRKYSFPFIRKIVIIHLTNDKGEEKLLDFKWVTPEELKDIDLRPSNIKDMIINGEYLKGLSHIIKRG